MRDTSQGQRHATLADEICDRIVADFISGNKVKAGQLLPSEKDLTETYSVSRVTIRAAIRSLHEHGVVRVRNGVGAVVLPQLSATSALTHQLDRLASLDTVAREAGKELQTEELEWVETVATPNVSTKLRLPVGDPVIAIRRCRALKSVRVAWMVDWLPAGLIEVSTLKSEFEGSVLDVLLNHDEFELSYADLEVVPVVLDSEISNRLNVDPGGPALYLDTVVFGAEVRPDVWGQIWLLPEHFRFSIRRRRQFPSR